jgi:hypothetical protein
LSLKSVALHVVAVPVVDAPVVATVWDASARVRSAVAVVLADIMIVAAMAAAIVSAVAIMIAIIATAMVIAAVVVALDSADQWVAVPVTRDVARVVLAVTTTVVHPSAAGNHPFLAWCK